MVLEIHNPRELVDALGGVTKAAAALGERHPSTVSNWLKGERFPATKFMKHQATLTTLGIKANASIWFGRASVEAAE